MKILLAIAAASALTGFGGFATTAYAMDTTIVEANVDKPTAYVRYADLNLSRAADVQTLKDRVRRAANRICIDHGTPDLATTMRGRACRKTALESAAPQIQAAVSNYGNEQMASNAIAVALP